MKKFAFYITVLLLFMFVVAITPLNGREIIVNGNSYDVEIPSDMTAEEAFYEAFQLYLEAEDDCKVATERLKETTAKLDSLKEEVTSYQTEVDGYVSALKESKGIQEELKGKYEKLSDEYEELSSIYRKMLRPTLLRPYLGLGVDRDMKTEGFIPSLQVGAVVLEKFGLNTNIRYDIKNNGWSFGLQVGMKF